MKRISQKDFKQEVSDFKGIVVADFYADWCGPCKMLGPLMEHLSAENKDAGVKFVKVNVDENQDLASQFDVMSIPTVIFFKDGEMIEQKIGLQEKGDYEEGIKGLKAKKLKS